MTIASEITRLQTAKSDIQTSIGNKGVVVPDSAKLDAYSGYIDQIQQGDGGVLTGGLVLNNRRVVNKNDTPATFDNISFIENGKYYGCCVCSIQGSSASSLAFYIYTYRKLDSTNDISYAINDVTGGLSSAIYTWRPNHVSFWNNGTYIKILFFIDSTYSTNGIFLYQATWDYKNSGDTGNSFIGRGETTDLNDYSVDLDGYSQISGSDWVKSITGNEIDERAYIYLTLK